MFLHKKTRRRMNPSPFHCPCGMYFWLYFSPIFSYRIFSIKWFLVMALFTRGFVWEHMIKFDPMGDIRKGPRWVCEGLYLRGHHQGHYPLLTGRVLWENSFPLNFSLCIQSLWFSSNKYALKRIILVSHKGINKLNEVSEISSCKTDALQPK